MRKTNYYLKVAAAVLAVALLAKYVRESTCGNGLTVPVRGVGIHPTWKNNP